jgi:ABC-type multidrug transport system permease subunit
MSDRTLAARGSEYLREASVLVLVFGFLDPLVQPEARAGGLKGRFIAVELPWALLVIVVSFVLFFGGIALDRVRMAGTESESPESEETES